MMKSFKKFLLEDTDEIIHREAHHARDFLDWLHKKNSPYLNDNSITYLGSSRDLEIRKKLVNNLGLTPRKDMCGHCAIASMLLKHRLYKIHGINPTIVHGKYSHEPGEHFWLQHNDKIIDITKTQYGGKFKRVEIIHKSDPEYNQYKPQSFGYPAVKENLKSWKDQSLSKDLRKELRNEYEEFRKSKSKESINA